MAATGSTPSSTAASASRADRPRSMTGVSTTTRSDDGSSTAATELQHVAAELEKLSVQSRSTAGSSESMFHPQLQQQHQHRHHHLPTSSITASVAEFTSLSGGRSLTQQQQQQSLPPPLNLHQGAVSTIDGTSPVSPRTLAFPHVPAPAMHWARADTHGKCAAPRVRAHTAVAVDNLMFIFGGGGERDCFNDVHVFDAETMYWHKPQMTGDVPPPTRAHAATAVDGCLYVFGGGNGSTYYNDLYQLDIERRRWSKMNVVGERPCPRRSHTICYYRKEHSLYVFGGGDGNRALNDLHALRLPPSQHRHAKNNSNSTVNVRADVLRPASWEQIVTTGQMPPCRGYHTSNLVDNSLIVFGGSDGQDCYADVHVLDLEDRVWRRFDLSIPESFYTPPVSLPAGSCWPELALVTSRAATATTAKQSMWAVARLGHTATVVGNYLFLIGGNTGAHYVRDVILLNLVTMQWELRKVYGPEIPASRGYHATLLHDSRLFVLGGFDGQTVFDDTWILDLAGLSYLPRIAHFDVGQGYEPYGSNSDKQPAGHADVPPLPPPRRIGSAKTASDDSGAQSDQRRAASADPATTTSSPSLNSRQPVVESNSTAIVTEQHRAAYSSLVESLGDKLPGRSGNHQLSSVSSVAGGSNFSLSQHRPVTDAFRAPLHAHQPRVGGGVMGDTSPMLTSTQSLHNPGSDTHGSVNGSLNSDPRGSAMSLTPNVMRSAKRLPTGSKSSLSVPTA